MYTMYSVRCIIFTKITYGLREYTFDVDDVVINGKRVIFVRCKEVLHLFSSIVRDKAKSPEQHHVSMHTLLYIVWLCTTD